MFADYEKIVLRTLTSGVLSPDQLGDIVENGTFVSYEYTGWGYFFSVSHSNLPSDRVTCSQPIVIGSVNGIECGFVVFIENGELTLECYTSGSGDIAVTEDFRTRNVQINVEPQN